MQDEQQVRINTIAWELRVANLKFKELTPYHWRISSAGLDIWPTQLRVGVAEMDRTRAFKTVKDMMKFINKMVAA